MQDLIYCNDREEYDEISAKLKSQFANIKITDASDDVHEDRFEIELKDEQRREYRKYLIKEGYGLYSLSLSLITMQNPQNKVTSEEDYNEVIEILAEIEKEANG